MTTSQGVIEWVGVTASVFDYRRLSLLKVRHSCFRWPRRFLELSVKWICAVAKKKNPGWILWSKDEIKLLKRLYKDTEAKIIAEQMGRTAGAVRRRAGKLGIQNKQHCPWSKKDLEILKKLHPTEKLRVIAEKLGRSAKAVAATAIRLGLRKQKASVPWSRQEEALLRKFYLHKSCEEIAEQIGRSVRATRMKIFHLGLRKKKRKT